MARLTGSAAPPASRSGGRESRTRWRARSRSISRFARPSSWSVALAGGALGVMAVVRAIDDLLYGVRPFDPLTLGAAVATLVACAVVALLVPVRRATRVDPITTLR